MDATDHDQLFKTVIRDFFPDFLGLFFPDQAARLDLSAVNWLDKELLPEPPDGPQHVLDLVAEVRRAAGDTALALVHVEIESDDSVTRMEARLPAYYIHLRDRHRKPVLPLVVYLKVGLDGLGVRTVTSEWEGEPVLTLRYRYVGLPALPATDYLRGDNWLGVALSALMRAPKDQRIALGVEAIERLLDSPLSDGRKALLSDCVETYIEIPSDDVERFRGILEANATGRVQSVNKTRVQIAEERGIETGIEKGIEQGELRALRAAVAELLEARFGPLPAECAGWLAATADPAVLRRANLSAGTAPSLKDFRAVTGW